MHSMINQASEERSKFLNGLMGMHKNKIPKVNKPFLSGVATLELSKTVMYIKKIWK